MGTVSDRLGVDEVVEFGQLFRRHRIGMLRSWVCSTFYFAYVHIRMSVPARIG